MFMKLDKLERIFQRTYPVDVCYSSNDQIYTPIKLSVSIYNKVFFQGKKIII